MVNLKNFGSLRSCVPSKQAAHLGYSRPLRPLPLHQSDAGRSQGPKNANLLHKSRQMDMQELDSQLCMVGLPLLLQNHGLDLFSKC